MSSTIVQLVVHCEDVGVQSSFWSRLLGREVDRGATADHAGISLTPRSGTGPALLFLRAPGVHRAPHRLHLDLVHSDRTTWRAEVDRAVALGATTVAEHEGFGWRWATLHDPEGNAFDLGVNPAVDQTADPGNPAGPAVVY
ncbi:VOC family protein [Kineococcus rhizosphaerae]|uniref:Glyoxalase-like domain-containing protein n=1 Tax=Kineococcus rhizosphaerae TaxID=559628 RepID=A0A2T0R319_9ACTN|nr:VOC family protein [Kineococcus rhizosphaerae]PRY14143.1 hypothetical protein CLV37_107262 [Kineococcus rhizosphaerae]